MILNHLLKAIGTVAIVTIGSAAAFASSERPIAAQHWSLSTSGGGNAFVQRVDDDDDDDNRRSYRIVIAMTIAATDPTAARTITMIDTGIDTGVARLTVIATGIGSATIASIGAILIGAAGLIAEIGPDGNGQTVTGDMDVAANTTCVGVDMAMTDTICNGFLTASIQQSRQWHSR